MAKSSTNHLSNKHIIIAGGGISGLAFVVALHKQWVTCDLPLPRITIYERDEAESRLTRQGYSMSIRSDGERGGGIQVLDDLGLYEIAHNAAVLTDSFDATNRDPDGSAFVVWESRGDEWKVVLRMGGRFMKNQSVRKLGSMRIRRNALQKVLLDAISRLPRVTLEFGKTVTTVEQIANETENSVKISFIDASSTTADILIDATGSSSKIRNSLRPELSPPTGLDFAETVIISGTAKFESHMEIPKPVRKQWGLLQCYNGIGCFASPVDETSALWSVSYRSKSSRERLQQPLSETTTAALLEEARTLGKDGGPTLRRMIDATDPNTLMIINCSDRPPFIHDVEKHGNVIHIGDANHAVSPFAGNGANMALIDGWDLARAIIEYPSLELAIKHFESTMVKRCQAVLEDSHNNIAFAHVTGLWAWVEWAKINALGWVMWFVSFLK